ncbi:MAG: polysaccharide deacetylase [SAR202 cluster bacterium]|nr:polysaccharide deacetylase [SAR202 cluster bacterium]
MLEPDRFDYSPIFDRPAIKWPNNARVALWVSPNMEHYEYLPPKADWRNQWPRTPHPDVSGYAHKDYGNRVAFWRMLEVMDAHKIRCTVSLNEAVLEHFPDITKAMVKRDYDYMSHGIYNTRFLNKLTLDEERAFYKDCIDTLKKHTGKQLKGMLTPAISPTEATPDLMAEAGLIYHADWFHDDQPFPLKVKSGRLISMPYAIDINDGTYNRFGCTPEYWYQSLKNQFDIVYEEGAESGRTICLSLHPYIIAAPSRIKYLDAILDYILSHAGVWNTTGDEIAQYYMDNYHDMMVKHLKSKKSPVAERAA